MISINDNKKLFEGFFTVCDAVSQTMGAQGRLAIIENKILGNPIITKDGISTAKEIFFENNFKNIGAHLAKQVAARTLVSAGDSTTSSLVFARALVNNSKKRKWLFGKKQYFFNKRVEQGMDLGYERFCELLTQVSRPVDDEAIRKIATVSSNNNTEIGDLVFKAYKAVGKGGIIDVQQSNSYVSYLDESKGMKLSKGWESPFLINNQKTAKFEGDNALVIVYEGYFSGDKIIEDFLENVERDRPIIIVAERFHEDTIIKLIEINQRRILNITAVQCPEFDNKRKALLEDLALFTGGKLFLQGGKDTTVTAGTVDRLIVTESSCSFIKNEVSQEVQYRIEELKQQMESVTDKDFIRRRIQNLEGVSATINVGGTEELERKERFDRVEDAVCSIQSAQEEGWISGGGSGLVYISKLMEKKDVGTHEMQFGYNMVVKSLREPFMQICSNANRDYRNYIGESEKIYGKGYNAYTDRKSNLIEDNIIDSSKSIRTALQNALSVTKLLLNAGIVITLNNKEDEQ